ncbi:hypothetical protein BKA93DRAFT_748229 [Sparassis latifolia]
MLDPECRAVPQRKVQQRHRSPQQVITLFSPQTNSPGCVFHTIGEFASFWYGSYRQLCNSTHSMHEISAILLAPVLTTDMRYLVNKYIGPNQSQLPNIRAYVAWNHPNPDKHAMRAARLPMTIKYWCTHPWYPGTTAAHDVSQLKFTEDLCRIRLPTELLSSRIRNVGTQISPHTMTQTNMSAEHDTARESRHFMREVVGRAEERQYKERCTRRKFNMPTLGPAVGTRTIARAKGKARRVTLSVISCPEESS